MPRPPAYCGRPALPRYSGGLLSRSMPRQGSVLGRRRDVHRRGLIWGTWGARSLAKERAHGLPGAVIVRGHEVRVASEDDFLGVPEVRRYLSARLRKFVGGAYGVLAVGRATPRRARVGAVGAGRRRPGGPPARPGWGGRRGGPPAGGTPGRVADRCGNDRLG